METNNYSPSDATLGAPIGASVENSFSTAFTLALVVPAIGVVAGFVMLAITGSSPDKVIVVTSGLVFFASLLASVVMAPIAVFRLIRHRNLRIARNMVPALMTSFVLIAIVWLVLLLFIRYS